MDKFVLLLSEKREKIDLSRFDKFKERVFEIQEIRSQHDTMLSILGYNNTDKETLSKTLEIFCKVK